MQIKTTRNYRISLVRLGVRTKYRKGWKGLGKKGTAGGNIASVAIMENT